MSGAARLIKWIATLACLQWPGLAHPSIEAGQERAVERRPAVTGPFQSDFVPRDAQLPIAR